MAKRRNRLAYSLFLAIVIGTGLLSRSGFAVYLPSFISEYAGDTLWSLALFLTICIVFPMTRLVIVALLTIAISFGVEFSQIYQADWINTIRGNRIGALFLGAGFKVTDLACYTVGCLMGVGGELMTTIDHRKTSPDEVLGGVGSGEPADGPEA